MEQVVLSACSSYFQSLFLDHPSRHPIVILKDVRFAELRTLIDFMYKGEVNVEYCQLSALLKTAESLKVKHWRFSYNRCELKLIRFPSLGERISWNDESKLGIEGIWTWTRPFEATIKSHSKVRIIGHYVNGNKFQFQTIETGTM